MFHPVVRFLLVAACVLYGVWSLQAGRETWIVPFLAAGLLAWGYFRHGTVWLAFRAARRGDFDRSGRLIAKVREPERLTDQNRAYYHWIRGMLALERGDLAPAREHLETAGRGKLRTANDRSIVACQTAEVCARLGDRAAAQVYLTNARAQPHKPQVDELIAKVERIVADL